jgi:hypothetical protein
MQMTSRKLLAIFVRVLGLWFIAEGVIQLPALFYWWPADRSKTAILGYTETVHSALWVFLGSEALRFFCGGVFLIGAGRLAGWFGPRDLPDDQDASPSISD